MVLRCCCGVVCWCRCGCRCIFCILQCILNLAQKDVGLNGFGDVIGGTRLHSQNGVLHFGIVGHDDEGDWHTVLVHPCEQFQSVAVGQTEVAEHKIVGRLLLDKAYGSAYRRGFVHIESLLLEPCLHHCSESNVVLNNQYTCHKPISVKLIKCLSVQNY